MNETFKRRLKHLEQRVWPGWSTASEQVQQAALKAISDEDLDCLQTFAHRGAPLSLCSPAEKAALQRFGAECGAASRGIGGRRRGALADTMDP